MDYLYMRFPEGKSRALTLSYDDGVYADIRLMEIMNRHGLKGTFNLNSGKYPEEFRNAKVRRLTREQATDIYADCGHEVAVHGYRHLSLAEIAPELATYDVLQDRLTLEAQFDRIVRGMAYANGSYNDRVVEILRSCGIAYARTTVSTCDFKIPNDWLRMPATCHHNNPRLMELAEQFVTTEKNAPRLFYLWGHSYEFDNNDNWNVIEEFAAYMGDREDVWYATNIEIHDYVEAFRALQFSVNGDRVYNPSAQPIWFVKDSRDHIVRVASGETVLL